ncbi:S8 family serine peptidase [Plantactinospora sonchi]|uniref:S8 family serine peptidase n=1 Tax=Plantactinospora sonchi TaxID=1544735 RepID=A0ABU7S220_9ACTN
MSGPASAAEAADTAQDAQTWVTLITGDRVLVRGTDADARPVIDPAPRAGLTQFQEFTHRGDRYVVPRDASALVRDGVLDRELFNVTGLVRQGYDDAHSPHLPLLVRYDDANRAARPAALAGSTVRRALPQMRLAALDERKSTAAQFWADLRTSARGLAAGVTRVWLNGRVRASLEQSVPQIGAPAAWHSGQTGAGVTVAVLDSGVDVDHPDFAGRLGALRDFTGKGSVEDDHGHGTHVASIIAGSGAADHGRNKGVAPDATLAIGKVLDNTGSGTFDDILAGMQWAAESGAKVVNMSLGSGPTDGADPMSLAVNDLTRAYGTLFVISSGNFGGDRMVSAPGTADEALTVGSVSRSDVLSPFSSRGPRLGDGALKPELTAPGEEIVAARPAGVDPIGAPVGDAYQRISGTSMAAPHVAGAAALLAQQHPDWPASRLKATLTSTAVEVAGAHPYAVGTGRVDVARATSQPVTATGSVSTFLRWPHQDDATRTSTVTWQNSGKNPVTLALSASVTRRDGQPAPAGLLTLADDSVTVPAGSDATVRITVAAQTGGAGEYAGVLEARGADGATLTRTGLAVHQEEEKYDLTVDLVDRDGEPASADPYTGVTLLDLDHVLNSYQVTPGEKIRLPRGRYALHGTVATPRGGQEPEVSFISHPELVLDRDMVQTLDARIGKPVSITTDNPAANAGVHNVSMFSDISDCSCTYSVGTDLDPRLHQVYAATVSGTSSPGFAFTQARLAEEATLELHAQTGQPFQVRAYWMSEPGPAEQLTLAAVDGGAGTPEDLSTIDAKGKLVLARIPDGTSWEEIFRRTTAIAEAGGKLAMLIPTSPAEAMANGGGDPGKGLALPTISGVGPTAERFAELVKAGPTEASYTSRRAPNHRYELAYGVQGQLSTAQVRQPRTRDLVAVHAVYHDNAVGAVHSAQAFAQFAGREHGVGAFSPVLAGQERVEYHTPGTWRLSEQAGPGTSTTEETMELRAGQRYRVVWNKAVTGPSLRGLTRVHAGEAPRPWAWRTDDAIDVALPMFGDSVGRPRLPSSEFGDSGSISLHRDGQPVDTSPTPDAARFDVPAAPGSYRLVAEAGRPSGAWRLWTHVAATWTFRSSAADNTKALPLLTVRFDPAVDLRNRAPGGRQFSFPAYVTRQGASTVKATSLTVDVSYDDGTSWRPTTVVAAGDHWKVSLTHPATGHASLRATAVDQDGNTVEQTVLRAYGIGQEN